MVTSRRVRKPAENPDSPECCAGGCHVGSFWFWAIIRILIVVGMIIGAYILGVRCGSYGNMGMYGENWGRSRNGMMQNENRPRMPVVSKKPHTAMDMSMTDMSKMLEGKTGDDLDKAFLEAMIPHHQGAVDMAKYLAGSKHPELVKLGANIITSQTKEIEQMKKWMQDWGYTATGATLTGSTATGMMNHSGMMMR